MKYLVENKILLSGREYTFIINRKKIRHIYFRVKEDLNIHVNCSNLVTQKQIIKLLKENETDIIKMYNIAKKSTNEELKYLGNKLEFIEHNSKPHIEDNYIYAKTIEEAKKHIYTKAKDMFSKRLEQLKPLFDDLPEFELKTRKMTSKWGVCNKKSMTITINTELITKDVHLIDYVIIHELSHFKHMNHSKEFWQYVEKVYPYYKKARKELKY